MGEAPLDLGESLQKCFHYFNGWCIISLQCKMCTSWIEDGTTKVMHLCSRLVDDVGDRSAGQHIAGYHLVNHLQVDACRLVMAMLAAITNHAPIGEYRHRFFPDKPGHCHHCGDGVFHSRHDVLVECSRYKGPFSTLRNL